jgi:hypothetical protein
MITFSTDDFKSGHEHQATYVEEVSTLKLRTVPHSFILKSGEPNGGQCVMLYSVAQSDGKRIHGWRYHPSIESIAKDPRWRACSVLIIND